MKRAAIRVQQIPSVQKYANPILHRPGVARCSDSLSRQGTTSLCDLDVEIGRLVAISLLEFFVERVQRMRVVPSFREKFREMLIVQTGQVAKLPL